MFVLKTVLLFEDNLLFHVFYFIKNKNMFYVCLNCVLDLFV